MTDDANKAAHQFTSAPEGWLAIGHRGVTPLVPGDNATTMQLDYQQRTPGGAVELGTVYGNEGPIASSIRDHQGRAAVQLVDQSAAASPGLAAQFGVNAPGGLAPQPPDHVAPTGVGAQFRQSPQRPAGAPAMAYDHEPAQIQRPSTWAMPDGAA